MARDEETLVLTRKGTVFLIGFALVIVGSAWLVSAWMCALTVPGMHHWGNENDLITEVSLINTNPLILSVNARSNCTDDIVYLVGACIKGHNQTTVAECWGEWHSLKDYGVYLDPICVLPDFGSEETLTLNFETSLPSGTYTLWFHSIGGVVASSGEVFTRADVERAIYPLAYAYFTVPYSIAIQII